MARIAQGLTNERDVVGSTAAAARLADDHSGLGEVVLAALDSLHDLARHEDRGIADVVVHIAQARLDGAAVGRRQKLQVIAVGVEHLFDQVKVNGRHLRAQDGVALAAHLLGKGHLVPGRGLALTLRLDTVLMGGKDGLLVRRLDRARLAHLVGLTRSFGLGTALGLLILEGSHERAHANARGTEVRHLVDLEHGVDLAGSLHDLLYLIGGKSIEAAAKRVELDEVEVVAHGHKARGRIEARVEHPLVDHTDGALGLDEMRHRVLGKHGKAKGTDKLGQRVIDLGIVMVGTAGEHDAMAAVPLDPMDGLLAHGLNSLVEASVLFVGGVHSGVDLGARDLGARHATATGFGIGHAVDSDKLVQAALELNLIVIRHEGIHELDMLLGQLVDVEAECRGIAHDDWAVVAVARRRVLLALPAHTGHPDEIGILVQQVHDVTMAELGRVAHALGRHGLDARFVGLLVGLVGQHDREAKLGKETMPERVVLVHIECARDAHGTARGVLGC